MVTDGSNSYEHSIKYREVEPIYYIPESNVTLYANSNKFFLKNRKKNWVSTVQNQRGENKTPAPEWRNNMELGNIS